MSVLKGSVTLGFDPQLIDEHPMGDITVEKMEEIIFKWLCEADDLSTYTAKVVREKMEKHFNLPAKSLKKHKGLNQATENVCCTVNLNSTIN